MKYLINSELELNSIFIIKPFYAGFVGFEIHKDLGIIIDPYSDNPELPLSEKSFIDSWKLYKYTAVSEEETIKESLTREEFHIQKHEAKFSFIDLEKKLNLEIFKEEFSSHIDKKRVCFEDDIKEYCMKVPNNFIISEYVQSKLKEVNNSINNLNELSLNKTQLIVKKILHEKYNLTIENIKTKYEQYLPARFQFEDEKLDSKIDLAKYVFHDKIKSFKEIESKLITQRWITEKNNKLNWNENKTNLVDLCRYIDTCEILRPTIKLTSFITFLEDRYNCKTKDLKKPSKFNKRPLQKSKFYFLFN